MGYAAAGGSNYGAKKINQLKTSIVEDPGIDDESRAELLSTLESKKRSSGIGTVIRGGDFNALTKSFAAAREGTDPLYATRRLFQNRRQSVLSQPGRSQTVLTR